MIVSDFIIREIESKDNPQIEQVLRSVMEEMGMPKKGTAWEDIALLDMHGAYQKDKAAYYVIEYDGTIVGGGGISH